MLQRPGRVVGPVGRETEGAVRLEHARDGSNGLILHEAALPKPALRPGIGVAQVEPLAAASAGGLCAVRKRRACQAHRSARLSASARSILSQEKPPSLSGARPKWP